MNEQQKLKNRERAQKRYELHREEENKRCSEWRRKNRSSINNYQRKYYKNNREKWRTKYNNYLNKDGELDRGTCGMGRKFELYVLSRLDGAVDMNKDCFKGKYDILWNGKRIEVKARNIYKDGLFKFSWRRNQEVDLVLCLCVSGDVVLRSYLIPSSELKTGFSVRVKDGHESKYDKFKIEI